jgi:hypothetical protein
LISSLGEIARCVLCALDENAPPVIPDSSLKAFQVRCVELHNVDALPYPGCRHCESPCSFRFDMAHVDPKTSKDFRQAYLDVSIPTHRLAKIAGGAADRSFFISDLASNAGAAFCFSVQELANPALGLATYNQLQVATLLKKQITLRK